MAKPHLTRRVFVKALTSVSLPRTSWHLGPGIFCATTGPLRRLAALKARFGDRACILFLLCRTGEALRYRAGSAPARCREPARMGDKAKPSIFVSAALLSEHCP